MIKEELSKLFVAYFEQCIRNTTATVKLFNCADKYRFISGQSMRSI